MRLANRAAFVLILPAAMAVAATAQDKLEAFVGYSYLRPSMTYQQCFQCEAIIGCPPPPPVFITAHPNLNGYEFSATYKLKPRLGVTGDFSGHYGIVASHSSAHVQTFLFGPEVSLPAKVSPFVHLLVGGAHESIGSSFGPLGGFSASILPTSGNSFATALGAGIDLRLTRFISVRPVQVDYLLTRAYSTTQNQPRVSAGVLLRL